MKIKRFEIYLVTLDPTVGSGIRKTRPCIVISPDEMNRFKTVIIAPLTSKGFEFIFRPRIDFQNREGLVLLDQIRTVDKKRLVTRVGKVEEEKAREISDTLLEMFRY